MDVVFLSRMLQSDVFLLHESGQLELLFISKFEGNCICTMLYCISHGFP